MRMPCSHDDKEANFFPASSNQFCWFYWIPKSQAVVCRIFTHHRSLLTCSINFCPPPLDVTNIIMISCL